MALARAGSITGQVDGRKCPSPGEHKPNSRPRSRPTYSRCADSAEPLAYRSPKREICVALRQLPHPET